jgi:hypothetical protein
VSLVRVCPCGSVPVRGTVLLRARPCQLLPRPDADFRQGRAAPLPKSSQRRMIRRPGAHLPLTQIVLVIEAELLQTGSGNVGQFELRLLRRPRGQAPFGDVLHAASCGLHHLVVSAAATIDMMVAEPDRQVVDQAGDLEALNPLLSPGSVARRWRGVWLQGARRRLPQSYWRVRRGGQGAATRQTRGYPPPQ